jgi:hypothetical protein
MFSIEIYVAMPLTGIYSLSSAAVRITNATKLGHMPGDSAKAGAHAAEPTARGPDSAEVRLAPKV